MPVAVRYIHSYLAAEGQVDEDRFAAALAPATLSQDGKAGSDILTASLTTCEEIGLVRRTGSTFELHPDLLDVQRADGDAQTFRATIRQLVLGRAVNDDLWGSDTGMRDFTRAICWYLTLDAVRAPGQYDDAEDVPGASQLQSVTLAEDDRVFRNENRWPQFGRWAPFLGLATLGARRGKIWLQPDPTVAVRDGVRSLFRQRSEWPIRAVIGALATESPVLDGGRYRTAVEQRMTSGARGSDTISPSLALALTRLRLERVIAIHSRPDADTMVWTTVDGQEVRVSHLEITG